MVKIFGIPLNHYNQQRIRGTDCDIVLKEDGNIVKCVEPDMQIFQQILCERCKCFTCKLSVDSSHLGILLTDLCKAFDCFPHQLIICKLRACGLAPGSCKLIMSYFTISNQRVKVGNCKSECLHVNRKGYPARLYSTFSKMI